MAKERRPTKKHLSRAGKDMHARNAEVRKEAAEVLALAPRHPTRGLGKRKSTRGSGRR
jgi:hypothetical protein